MFTQKPETAMSAHPGKDLLLKVQVSTGAFVSVAGIRSRELMFNADSIDTTHSDSAGRWRTLLAGTGAKSVRITGGGIFKDAASDALIRTSFFDGTNMVWQIMIPDFGEITGPFQITTLTYGGELTAAVTFQIVLHSAGAINFAPH
jgi:TP901-1 family phage major tail protein